MVRAGGACAEGTDTMVVDVDTACVAVEVCGGRAQADGERTRQQIGGRNAAG